MVGTSLRGTALEVGLELRVAPPAAALANISLKPEWTKGRGKTETLEDQRVSPLPSGEMQETVNYYVISANHFICNCE